MAVLHAMYPARKREYKVSAVLLPLGSAASDFDLFFGIVKKAEITVINVSS